VVEQWSSANAAIPDGREAELPGSDLESREIAMLTPRLLQSALVLLKARLVDGPAHRARPARPDVAVLVEGRPVEVSGRGNKVDWVEIRPHCSHGQAAIGGHLTVGVGGRTEVFHLAGTNPPCRDLCDCRLAVWSALAGSLVHAYGPEIVIVGGVIVAAGDHLFGPLADYLRGYAWTPWGGVRLRSSEGGADAAVLGHAVIAQGG
jgi:hypothetical protein